MDIYFIGFENIHFFDFFNFIYDNSPLKAKLVDNKHDFHRFSILSFFFNDCIIIQSTEFEQPSSIPRFLMKIFEDFTYVAYHCGIKCTITPLSSNRIKYLYIMVDCRGSYIFSKCDRKEP